MNWYDKILQEFIPQVAFLTLVADPDSLLASAGILQKIQSKGFEVIFFEDTISFRYLYESQYRYHSTNKTLNLVLVLKTETQELRSLPYDLLKSGRQLAFSITSLFPNLSYNAVNALDRSDFDALYQAQTQYNPQQLGENATKDFLLRHVFNIDTNTIKQIPDLLLILLRRHYSGQRIPAILDEYLIKILREKKLFANFPLETIIPNRQAFFAFLQENWLSFLRQKSAKSPPVAEDKGQYQNLANLPFDNDNIRIYIHNLFLEGYLQPVNSNEIKDYQEKLQLNPWIKIGLHIDSQAEKIQRLESLIKYLNTSIPNDSAKYQDWLIFVKTWSELIVLWYKQKVVNLENEFILLQQKVDNNFLSWVNLRYKNLYNQVANTPVIVHQIPRFIERYLEKYTTRKVALIVLDGLSYDQWLILRNVLLTQNPQLKITDEAVFAWLPTITSVSRQAIFAGKPPVYFPNSINTTAKEESLWKQYWTEKNFPQSSIIYMKGLGEDNTISLLEAKLSPKTQIIGLVVDKIDKIMHGMQLGTAGMHNQVRQWAELGIMSNLLDFLLENNFQIFLTSDHGNIEATGIGQPKEGAIADLRGERVRVYSDPILRTNIQTQFPSTREWQAVGLPAEYLPLLAPSRQSFTRETEKIIAHGSITIEELIVPFISISK